MSDDMIALVMAFSGGLVIGAVIAAIVARSAWRVQLKPYDIPGYDPANFVSRCPDCNAPYIYPPRCAPGYCAKVKRMPPMLAPLKTRCGTPGKDILE